MLIITRRKETYIWFTLNPETTRLTPRTMTELMKVVAAVKLHGEAFWGFGDEKCEQV